MHARRQMNDGIDARQGRGPSRRFRYVSDFDLIFASLIAHRGDKWNPAPDKEVYWSEQSWDEMYNPQIRWTWDLQDLTKK